MMDLRHKRAPGIAVYSPANPHCTRDILEFDRISQRCPPTRIIMVGACSGRRKLWSSVLIAFCNHDSHGRMGIWAIAHSIIPARLPELPAAKPALNAFFSRLASRPSSQWHLVCVKSGRHSPRAVRLISDFQGQCSVSQIPSFNPWPTGQAFSAPGLSARAKRRQNNTKHPVL